MGGQLRIGAAVLRDAEEFLTDRGADGMEGTGLVACGPDGTAGARRCSWRRSSGASALSWDAGWRSPNGASGSW